MELVFVQCSLFLVSGRVQDYQQLIYLRQASIATVVMKKYFVFFIIANYCLTVAAQQSGPGFINGQYQPEYHNNTYNPPKDRPYAPAPSNNGGSRSYSNDKAPDTYKTYVEPPPESGYHTYVYPDGLSYTGYFQFSRRSGNGKLSRGILTVYDGEWANDTYNGKGTLVNGSEKYVGNFVDGEKSGHGISTSATGDKFDGEWKNNKKRGQGTFIKANGDKYEGEWLNDMMNGAGTYTTLTGEIFTGHFKDGLRDGPGKLSNASGRVIQEGSWEKGSYFSSLTEHIMPDGSKYYGELKDGKKTGHGIWKLPAGDMYDGEFTNDMANGNGIGTSPSGRRYVGEYKDNKKEGQGTLTTPEYTYTGAFKGGFREGFGKLSYPDGRIFSGYFKKDQINGTGTMTAVNGDEWTGEWAEDKLNGKGTFTGITGAKYTGTYKDGLPEGKGKWADENGNITEGDWTAGFMEGKGVWTNGKGEKYEGEWQGGKPSGLGQYDSAGAKYVGRWWNGKENGAGVYTYADGTKFDGLWYNNERDDYGTLYDATGKIQIQGKWKKGKFLDPNIPAISDLKKVFEAASNRFKDSKGNVTAKQRYKGEAIKTYSTQLSVRAGSGAVEITSTEITDFGNWIRFEEKVSFKNEADRDRYLDELSAVLPANAVKTIYDGYLTSYPGVSLILLPQDKEAIIQVERHDKY
ncbi:MAG: repeat protein [Bacteroidota bacterium]|nr:repeat protein [Bacteroidota bacterium]